MKFIIGLGNPGLMYGLTKHNVGAAVVKQLAREYKIKIREKRHSALIGRGKISGEDMVLVLPQTYMNLSGKSVSDLLQHEVRSIDDILVVCDDINLKLGGMRLKKQGSSGGHKGLESIISLSGRDDFARLRVGIATDVHKGDITRYVLTPFKRKEHKNMIHAINLAQEAVICWIEKGLGVAMNKFNIRKEGTS